MIHVRSKTNPASVISTPAPQGGHRFQGLCSPISKRFAQLGAAFLLCTTAGCVIPVPIAVFPAPCVTEEAELRFNDCRGNQIKHDGLLLVSRSQSIRGLPCAPSNHVVQIRQGRARIPHEWVPASIWLWPYEMAFKYAFAGHPVPPGQRLMAMAATFMPLPLVHPDEDHVFAIPLISGYHRSRRDLNTLLADSDSDLKKGGTVLKLASNCESPSNAHLFRNEVRQRIRRIFEPTRFEEGPDLRLNHYYYPRVKALVQRELDRIIALESGAHPSDAHRITSVPESDVRP